MNMGSPCPGYSVTTPYGTPGSWAAGYHTGDDYAAPMGTPVVAAASGVVITDGWDDDYGNFIEVETSGVRHRYCHLRDRALLGNGGYAGQGQLLGYVGSTGNSTGPHLHYEERNPAWGYWDHRPPRFNHETQTQPPLVEEEGDMFHFILRFPDGAAFLIAGAKVAYGLASGETVASFAAGGIPVVDADQKSADTLLKGRELYWG